MQKSQPHSLRTPWHTISHISVSCMSFLFTAFCCLDDKSGAQTCRSAWGSRPAAEEFGGNLTQTKTVGLLKKINKQLFAWRNIATSPSSSKPWAEKETLELIVCFPESPKVTRSNAAGVKTYFRGSGHLPHTSTKRSCTSWKRCRAAFWGRTTSLDWPCGLGRSSNSHIPLLPLHFAAPHRPTRITRALGILWREQTPWCPSTLWEVVELHPRPGRSCARNVEVERNARWWSIELWGPSLS